MSGIEPRLIQDELLPAIFTEDLERIESFLMEHVQYRAAALQLFITLPSVAAIMLKENPELQKPAADELWTFQLLGLPDQVDTITSQLLVAAMNDDRRLVDDLAVAIMSWPEEAHYRVMSKLMLQLITVFRMHPRPGHEPQGDGHG